MATQVNPLSLPGAAPSTLSTQGSSKLGKEEFLKLLTTQLANQNPLEPVDNQAFIAQLAQFATVEQQSQMNSTLESLLMAQASNNQTGVANLVGKDVTFTSDKITRGAADTQTTINGNLLDKATKVNAIITDASGKTVRTITITAERAAGPISIDWDGRDSTGKLAPAGQYTVKLTAENAEKKSVAVTPQGRGRANGVSFADGVPQLIVNGVRVRLSDVLEVNEPNSTTAP
ncbi:MAG: flagellar hook assembly protein FlgD [Archangium sp.]|nr:flagellar hook assembly protein FlgD [Archangium sp.]